MSGKMDEGVKCWHEVNNVQIPIYKRQDSPGRLLGAFWEDLFSILYKRVRHLIRARLNSIKEGEKVFCTLTNPFGLSTSPGREVRVMRIDTSLGSLARLNRLSSPLKEKFQRRPNKSGRSLRWSIMVQKRVGIALSSGTETHASSYRSWKRTSNPQRS